MSAAPIKTLDDAIARIEQLERAIHLNIGPDGKAIPYPPEPKVPHILINLQERKARTVGGLVVPVAAGYVFKNMALPMSHVAMGLHPTAPGAAFVPHPTLKEGDTASPTELATIVDTGKVAQAGTAG